jgi:NTE family protein
MNKPHSRAAARPSGKGRSAFECIALVLQGGGALGSYQAGVYEALAEAGASDWIAGISIGAINSAIIAGNAPQAGSPSSGILGLHHRQSVLDMAVLSEVHGGHGDFSRGLFNQVSAGMALFKGAAGFFEPRRPSPHPNGSLGATSFLRHLSIEGDAGTLHRFRPHQQPGNTPERGAVNVRTGNFTYFDTETHLIRPEHIMASGSLPPGFPATEIDGEFYWDGGLISNTPLQWVADGPTRQDTSPSRSTCGMPRASCPATWSMSPRARRTSSIPVAHAAPPIISNACSGCAACQPAAEAAAPVAGHGRIGAAAGGG